MCDKAVSTYPCDIVVYEDPLLVVYFPDKYITQKMFYEALDGFLEALKLIPDWFVTIEMIQKNFTALYVDENILFK